MELHPGVGYAAWRRLCLTVLSLGMLVASVSAAPSGVERVLSCDKVHFRKGDFIEVVDTALVPVRGGILDIGEIDFTKTRSIHNAWYVMSSPGVSVQTGLGGEEFRAVLGGDSQTCGKTRIAPLSLEFDGSSLAPGRFEQPLSIFREDPGKPPLEAGVRKAIGFVRRVWIDARSDPVSSNFETIYRVHLINSGNIATGVLHLIPNESPTIEIRQNNCDGHALTPAASCDIKVALMPGGDARLDNGISIGVIGGGPVENTLWLNVRDRKLQVFTTNR